MFAAAQYADVVAMLKTRLAGLFPPAWYRELCESPTEAAVLHRLREAGIPPVPDGRLPTEPWLVAHWLIPDYRSVLLRIPRSARPVVRAWLDRLELENVKYAVRCLASGKAIRLDALIDLGPLATIPTAAFRDLAHMADLEAAARHTAFEAPLRTTAHRLQEAQGGFIVEAALDRSVYGELERAARRYRGPGAASLRRLTLRFLAGVVLLWVIRYRLSYGLPAEAVLGVAAAFSFGNVAAIVQHGASVATQEDLDKLWTDVASQIGLADRPDRTGASGEQALSAWERQLWRTVHRAVSRLLLGPPFSLAVVVGLLLLKEFAVRDIAMICQGRAVGLSPDVLVPLLIHRQAESSTPAS